MSETQLADQFLYQSSLKSDPDVRVSSRKRVPFVIDINQGSYANGIITIDATSQLNGAEGFGSLRDAYLMVPYKVSMKNTHATVAMGAVANRLCATLKAGNFNVIDGLSLELNGKSILSMGDYKLFWNNLRAQTEYSPQYIEKHGAESFLYPDNAQSMLYNASGATVGDGYSNNTAFSSAFGVAAAGGATIPNDGFVKRLLSNPPTAGVDAQAFWPSSGGVSTSTTIANQLSRGAFVAGAAATAGSVLGTWNYMLKIKLTDLHPIFKELDLLANPQIRLRLRINQGVSAINITSAGAMSLATTTLSSGQTCPVMVSSAAAGNPMVGLIPASSSAFSIAWGCVTNALEPTIDGTYMPFTTCRLYVPFHDLENPQAIISKPVKKIRYNTCYAQWFYQRAGIGKQSTQFNTSFDLQLSASIKNAKYVALLPFAEATNSLTAAVQQFQSPFDSAPATLHPGSSIRNFNVRIGSQQVFDISYDYDFHAFCNEFAKLGAINGDLTPELMNGLIDYSTWSLTNRALVADVSRLTEKDVPQAIQVMGTNCGAQGLNMLVLVISEQEMTFDRLTGEVLDYTAD